MGRKSGYEALVAKVAAALAAQAETRGPWPAALTDARKLSRVLGMVARIRDREGNTISEMSDGQLKLVVGEDEVCVEEEELEHELIERGLQDHLWH